jgi:hypothetical protein
LIVCSGLISFVEPWQQPAKAAEVIGSTDCDSDAASTEWGGEADELVSVAGLSVAETASVAGGVAASAPSRTGAELFSPDRHIMQTPKAHMIKQGSVLIRIGARPAATSQFQLSASPATIAIAAIASNTRGRHR